MVGTCLGRYILACISAESIIYKYTFVLYEDKRYVLYSPNSDVCLLGSNPKWIQFVFWSGIEIKCWSEAILLILAGEL